MGVYGGWVCEISGLIARDQPEQRENMNGGSEVKDDGGEGLPGCTSEALGARKLGRGRACAEGNP